MIDQFNIPNIQLLQSLGYKVDVVADFTNPGTISLERAEDLKMRLNDMGVCVFDIAIPRTLNFGAISKAYKKIRALINKKHYNLIHCHSPIGGAICRLAARNEREKGTKVFYTAHGFHFYDGAPLKNWIFFYPVEMLLSKYTDVLITINKEDYHRAFSRFDAKEVVYVPGVGVDMSKYSPSRSGRTRIRKELGLSETETMILSVGELNSNKNHEVVIKAVAGLNLTYVIVGRGKLKDKLETIAKEFGVDIRLVGFRNDVEDFYNAADMYVLPSIREGLNVSLMEAMATGLPVVCGKIRGNVDLIDRPGGRLIDPHKVDEVRKAIVELMYNCKVKNTYNQQRIKEFSVDNVMKIMKKLYTL